jgi:beta-lactamase class A
MDKILKMEEQQIKRKKYLIYTHAVVFILLGIGIGFIYHLSFIKVKCFQDYSFLNPQMACGEKPVINKSSYMTFETYLQNQIQIWEDQKDADRISVYFRDLQNGPVFGINEDDHFISSSLLKLPVAITILKLAETNPGLLDESFKAGPITKELEQFFKPEKQIEAGQVYTVEEFLKYSLIYSDNWANLAINKILEVLYPGKDMVLETLLDLGLIEPSDVFQKDISTRSYSSIFRILYNSSYLSSELSNKALDILSQSTFNQGIRAGLPEDLKTAHKFGERELTDGKNELHDCGIIYYPNNPYLLCVMTEGDDIEKLSGIISNISRMVYEEVDSRKI